MNRFLIADIATAPIEGCQQWLDPSRAPSTWKDAKKIADYCAEKDSEKIEKAGLDPDLARITGIGLWYSTRSQPQIALCRTEEVERDYLQALADEMAGWPLIGFNSLKFDWPFLMRRSAYLGVRMHISTDRFKTQHVDLSEVLTHRGLLAPKSLGFYVRRIGWSDLIKPLSGAEEAQVPTSGRWDDLEASIRHDVTATYRLAQWLGVVAREAVSA